MNPLRRGTDTAKKRRRGRPTQKERIAQSLHVLEQLRVSEWMVTADWAPTADRHAILAAVDEVLSSDWAQSILRAKRK